MTDFFPDLDKEAFPCLSYTSELKDWHDFIRRTPEEYAAWIDGVAKECETLELRISQTLKYLCGGSLKDQIARSSSYIS